MTLTIDRRLMDAMYAARLKLFVAAADGAHFARGLDRGALDASGIELILYESDQGGTARLKSPGKEAGEYVTLATPPTGHCILAAATPKGLDELSGLLGWWREHGANGMPEVLQLDALPTSDAAAWPAALYRRLLDAARSDAGRSAEREVQLCGQLFELRQEYEQARAAMQAMQDQLARLSQAPCHMVYAYSPSGEIFRPARGETRIRQPLPVPAEGLAGFDLFSPPAKEQSPPDEHLIITLRAREADAVLGTWTVRGSQLGRGWIRCSFPRALTTPMHQLEIDIHWRAAGEQGAGLALSPIQPWPELCAVVNNHSLNDALAHVVWSAVPGAKTGLSTVPFHPTDDARGRDTFDYVISRDEIVRIEPTTPTNAQYLSPLSGPSFRLHPLDGLVASAVLRDACLPGAQAISATVQITNPAARNPVEYALALAKSGSQLSAFPTDPKDPNFLGVSDWQRVPADGTPHVVGLALKNAIPSAMDLHVATRMAPGDSTAYQWADWLELRVTLRYSTPIEPVEA